MQVTINPRAFTLVDVVLGVKSFPVAMIKIKGSEWMKPTFLLQLLSKANNLVLCETSDVLLEEVKEHYSSKI